MDRSSITFKESEAAKYLQISQSYLRKLRTGDLEIEPGIPFIKIGKAIRYVKSDLDKWILNRERQITIS